MTPADLTPENTDAEIVDTLAAFRADQWAPGLALTRQHDGERQVWSRLQRDWVSVAEYAAEWRQRYRYRQVMGDEETVRELNRYERARGI